jgi:hypothetical protein
MENKAMKKQNKKSLKVKTKVKAGGNGSGTRKAASQAEQQHVALL